MSKAVLEITISADGYIAGTGVSEEQPLGVNGPLLHEWLFDKQTPADAELLRHLMNTTGAVILGHRTYRTAITDAWGGETPFAAPAFVICHGEPLITANGFRYISTGLTDALAQAKAAAGSKNVWIMGGASIAQQFLEKGWVDALHLHIAPVLLGNGTALFAPGLFSRLILNKKRQLDTPGATHLYYDIVK